MGNRLLRGFTLGLPRRREPFEDHIRTVKDRYVLKNFEDGFSAV